MQRGNHPVGNHPCSELAGGASADTAVKDQLHLAGPTDVQVLADYLFEEHSARYRPVQHLRQRELRLENRDLVAVTCLAIAHAVGMRQQSQPFPQQGVDLLRAESIADGLKSFRIIAAQDSIIESVESDPLLSQLPFGVFVSVEAELGVVGKVCAELQEERTKVTVHAINVEVVHHGR